MKIIKLTLIIVLISISSNAHSEAPPAEVKVTEVFEQEISQKREIIGIIDFDKRSQVSSEVSGLIKKEFVNEGTFVKKGHILFELNTDFVKKDIEIKKKEKERLEIKIYIAAKNLKRYQELLKNDSTTPKKYEDIEYEFRELIKQKEILDKSIEKLRLELQKSFVKAPFDGIILEKYKNEGEWIAPGIPLSLLASADQLCVKAALSEQLLKFIKIGDKISVAIAANNKKFIGQIKKITPVADLASKTFQVNISIPYFKNAIQNMSASAQIPISAPKKLKMITRDALIKYNDKDYIYTIQDNRAKMLPVNILTYEGEYAGVDNENIKAGLKVIIDGNDRLRPGDSLKIIK